MDEQNVVEQPMEAPIEEASEVVEEAPVEAPAEEAPAEEEKVVPPVE